MAESKSGSGTLVPTAVSGRPELIGRVLSERYRVDALVATGAFGAVYRGVHLHMRKQLAIKVLHPEIENFPELVHRFEREAVAGAHIAHPNVAVASDLGKFDGDSYFLVQEYIAGETLREVLARGPLPPERAARIARQVAAGLRAAHRKGILHRDLKPRNVMLVKGSQDFVKVIDFGFARVPNELPEVEDLTAPEWRKSDASIVFGTVAYLAPEASHGVRSVTEQSDLYALGVILYEMLAGRHPFDVQLPPHELFSRHRLTPPPSFAEIDPAHLVPEPLEAVVRRLLEKDPADRYRDADELIDALDDAMGEDPVYRACVGPDSLRPSPPPSPSQPQREVAAAPVQTDPPRPKRRPLVLVAILGVSAIGGVAVLRHAAPADAPPIVSAPAVTPVAVAPAPSAAPAVSKDEAPVDAKKQKLIALIPAGDTDEASAALLDLIHSDAGALADDNLQNAVVTLLARLPSPSESTDKVVYALTYNAGPAGLDALYGVFDRFPSSYTARHAESTLTWLYDRASPALRITWSLRKTECWDMPRLFERAGNEGDKRTLALLTAMHDPSCKPKRGRCCFPKNEALEKAITTLKKN